MNGAGTVEGVGLVRLLGVPTELQVRNLAVLEEVLHELRVMQAGHESGAAPVAGRLARLMDEILGGYQQETRASAAQAEEAVRRGWARFDLELPLPRDAVGHARALLGLLEEADELCRQERLLTLGAGEEVRALRRWMVDEMEAQLQRGERPRPCPL